MFLHSILAGYFRISYCKSFQKIPFILEIRDLWPESIVELGAIKKDSIIIKSLFSIAKYIYEKSALIVVVTKTFKEYLIEYGINKDKLLL